MLIFDLIFDLLGGARKGEEDVNVKLTGSWYALWGCIHVCDVWDDHNFILLLVVRVGSVVSVGVGSVGVGSVGIVAVVIVVPCLAVESNFGY